MKPKVEDIVVPDARPSDGAFSSPTQQAGAGAEEGAGCKASESQEAKSTIKGLVAHMLPSAQEGIR